MSLISDGVVNLNLGETLIGLDEGRLVNTSMEGREAWITHDRNLPGGSLLSGAPVGSRSRVRCVRNTTGAAILPGEIVIINPAAGLAGFGQVTAKSSANSRLAYVVDPTLPAAGCADDDLCFVFVQGPCKVLAPVAGIALASAGLSLSAGASGRAAVTADTAGTTKNLLGTFLTGIQLATANEGALLDCVLHPIWD